ncbi:MAG TPA: helix-turn-helix domain-containing protein [Blastocatellia bacterium]|jgi:cytoskeletal protein RodZ|nr:helix-turn-helix domain-containing protein [Blastocatellia bacterium]
MPTLGEELKRRREERGITLGDISESTRIGTRFLKAIESDNYSILPGGIFTRSFIRAYAKQVGLNEEEAVSLYNQQVAPPGVEQGQQSQAVDQARARRSEPVVFHGAPTRANWPTLIIAGGIIIFIGIIIMALVKKLDHGSGTQTAVAPPAVQATPSPQAQEPPAPQPSQAQAEAGQPPAAPPAEQQQPVTTGEPISVRLEAAEGDSSIRYWVDDAKQSTTLLLKQGETHDIPPAQNQVRLAIGNRLPLRLSINNRAAAFPPETSKFKAQVTISRENLQAFFQPAR